MSINYALSYSPLSKNFRKKLEFGLGESLYFLPLSELRQKKPFEIWRYLRSLRPNKLILAIEDQSSSIFLPILQLIAKITGPKQIIVVDFDLNCNPVKISEIMFACLRLIKATVSVHFFYWISCYTRSRLLKQPAINYEAQLSNAKHLLYLNANLWFGVKAGGSVGHIAGVVNAMVNKGLRVDYMAADKSPLLVSAVNFFCLPLLRAFGMPLELNYYYFNARVMRYLSSLKDKPNWDFIYQRMSIANFSGVALSRHLNIPLVLEYNGSEAWVAKNWGRRLFYHDAAVKAEDVCLKHAYRVVTISEVLKQELLARGVSPEKIVYYPNCIDPVIFNPEKFSKEDCLRLREKHHIPTDSIVVTFIGTFGRWHGVDILAKTIRLMIETDESWILTNKVYFLLLGDGMKMPEVKGILGDFINKPYIGLTGLVAQAEAPAYLAASDILLSPHVANADGSRFFGSPTKLFEYMAMGKAIIASDLEQIGEVLKHSLRATQLPVQQPNDENTELGVLCEQGNVKQLVEAIQFLIENDRWWNVLGKNARQEALAKYTWERHVGAVLH